MASLDKILGAHDVMAVLGRDVAVRLIDISGSGCLLQTETRITEGTTGTLKLSYGGHRLCRRCADHAMPGAERWRQLVSARSAVPLDRESRRAVAA